MNNKILLISAFVVVCLAQLCAPASMILHREEVLQHGKEFKFLTAPIDPNDPFRGKYVMLRFKENSFKVDTSDNSWQMNEEIYLQFRTDQNGFATISHITKTPPPAPVTDYLKAKVEYINQYQGQKEVFIQYPFDRFYMEESKAYEAELAYQVSQQDTTQQTYALVLVKDGDAVLKDVLLNGVPLKEVVKQQRGY